MNSDLQAVQPVIVNFFELETTDLEVTRDPGFAPVNIVNANQGFDIALTFQGDQTGPVWQALKGIPGSQAQIRYFAESIGPGTNDANLGVRNVPLNAAQDIYTAPQTSFTVLAGQLAPGIYRLSAQLTFNFFPAAAGFYEGKQIQVRP